MVLVGDVKGKTAIIVDDMADTCGTLVKAADVVIQHGANDVVAIVTHGILSGNAIEALNGSKLKHIVVTNTVPHEEKKALCDKIETIDISATVSHFLHIWRDLPVTNIPFSLLKHAVVPTTERAFPSSSNTPPWIEGALTKQKSIVSWLCWRLLSLGDIRLASTAAGLESQVWCYPNQLCTRDSLAFIMDLRYSSNGINWEDQRVGNEYDRVLREPKDACSLRGRLPLRSKV
jgi:hypothetical protein